MKDKPSKIKDVEALSTIIKILDPLTMDERKKIIAAANAFFLGSVPVDDESSKNRETGSCNIAEIISKTNLSPGKKAALVAYHLTEQKGISQFTLDDLRKIYEDIGFTPTDRFDMTLKSAVMKGNKLFKTAGHNKYALTFHGQEFGKSKLTNGH